MIGPYFCKGCLAAYKVAETCSECEGESEVVDIRRASEREVFVAELKERGQKRRKKMILAMETMAIICCAGVLFVGVTVAAGLESFAVSMAAKVGAVGLLAASWMGIPRIYDRQLRGRAEEVLELLTREREARPVDRRPADCDHRE